MTTFAPRRRALGALLAAPAASLVATPLARAQPRGERVKIRYGYLPVPTPQLYAPILPDLCEK